VGACRSGARRGGRTALEGVEPVDGGAEGVTPIGVARARVGEHRLDVVDEAVLAGDRLRRCRAQADRVGAGEVAPPCVVRVGAAGGGVAGFEERLQVRAGLVGEREVVGRHHLGAVVEHVGGARQAAGLHGGPDFVEPVGGDLPQRDVAGADVGLVRGGEPGRQRAGGDEVAVHAWDRGGVKLRRRSKRLAAVVAPV
jgi:hypothetical protein